MIIISTMPRTKLIRNFRVLGDDDELVCDENAFKMV